LLKIGEKRNMKKIVITVVTVAIAAIAAQAQSPRVESRMTAYILPANGATGSAAATTSPASSATTGNHTYTWGNNISDWSAYVPQAGTRGTTANTTAGTHQTNWNIFSTQHQNRERVAMAAVSRIAEREALRRAEAAYAAYVNAQADGEKEESTETAVTEEKPTEYPFYLYGREGHMMAMAETIAQTTKPAATQPAKTNKKEGGSWFARLMGFEKYEGETDQEWQTRLYYMSIK